MCFINLTNIGEVNFMSDIFNNIQTPSYSTQQAPSNSNVIQKEKLSVSDSLPASNVKNTSETDTVEISAENQNTKQGPIRTVKNFIANIKKFFSTTGEYIKGTVKGLSTGVVAGSVVYTGGSVINHFRGKAAAKTGQTPKNIPSKALAVTVGVLSLASNLWNASLNATEKKSNIDHRWTGHN